jgi:hypothetical protein
LPGQFATALLAFLWRHTLLCLSCCSLAFAALHTIRHSESPGRALESAVRVGPRAADLTGIVWSDPEPLPNTRGKETGTFQLKLERIGIAARLSDCTSLVAVTWTGILPKYGDRVVVAGALKPLPAARNPGQFDFSNYLRRQGVFSRLESKFVEDCRILGHGVGNPAVALALKHVAADANAAARDLDDSPEQIALISSMVLGMAGRDPR